MMTKTFKLCTFLFVYCCEIITFYGAFVHNFGTSLKYLKLQSQLIQFNVLIYREILSKWQIISSLYIFNRTIYKTRMKYLIIFLYAKIRKRCKFMSCHFRNILELLPVYRLFILVPSFYSRTLRVIKYVRTQAVSCTFPSCFPN